ncbi:hypothetical protein RJ639_027447 [Escallonia herrerae]|uniref:Amidohydrolase 3 domain-containing protein n=1 Tax=Escallonia herrerae TaxID=1293975 RepID=A0AA88X3H2_9ASTE|nr:hypothetical protein RJ639_027447 [Escallonia herrerae]
MAVGSGRILRVGEFSSVQDLAGYGTKVLNLEGKIVVPGFIDSHVHLIFGGLQMARVELRGVSTKDEYETWNNDRWGGELPMASWIDEITAEHPVWLSRMDGHMGLANSVALKIAGVTNTT